MTSQGGKSYQRQTRFVPEDELTLNFLACPYCLYFPCSLWIANWLAPVNPGNPCCTCSSSTLWIHLPHVDSIKKSKCPSICCENFQCFIHCSLFCCMCNCRHCRGRFFALHSIHKLSKYYLSYFTWSDYIQIIMLVSDCCALQYWRGACACVSMKFAAKHHND